MLCNDLFVSLVTTAKLRDAEERARTVLTQQDSASRNKQNEMYD
jgi:hypothetical protein